MSSEGGIWVDIFARLNMASANAAVNELRSIMRRAGDDASKSFGEHAAGMDAMKRQYREMADAANVSYREMEIGLGRLQAAEADLNRVRAENYGMHARERIAAEREFQAALVESQRLQRDAAADSLRSRNAGRDARDAADADAVLANGRPSDSVDRGRGTVVIPRGANMAGWGLAGLTAIVGAGGLRQDTMIQRNMAPLEYQQNMSRGDVAGLTQQAYAISQATGLSMDEVTKAFAAGGRSNTAGGDRYQGQGLTDLVRRSAQLSRTSGGQMDLGEALKAIRTTSHDYQMRDTGSVGGMLSRALAGNAHASDLAEALHSIEPMASAAHISPQEILAALNSVSQTGQTNEQTAQNLNSVLQGWAKPSGIVSQSMQQLGINPQDISTNLQQRGIGGTIDVFNDAFKKNLGPNGTVVIDAMKRATMLQDQQDQVYGKMSSGAQKFIDRKDVQMGMVSPFKARAELLKSGGFPGMTPQDEQLIETWIKERNQLNGPSDMLRRNQPLVQNILGAVGATSTREAGRTLTQLGMGVDPESQNRLKQFKDATKDIQGGSSGQSLDQAFNKSMDTTSGQIDKMKESFKNAESKMTDAFLPALEHSARALEHIADFFDKHQTVATALFDSMVGLTGIFLAMKVWNGGARLFSALSNGVNGLKGAMTEITSPVRNIGRNAAALADAETVAAGEVADAGAKSGAVGKAAGPLAEAEVTATGEVAAMGGAAATTAEEMKGSGIGVALKGAAATIGEVFSKGAMLAILGQIVGGSLDQAGIPNPGDAISKYGGHSKNPMPSWLQDPDWLKRLSKTPLLGGSGEPESHARGGIVGYSGGTGDAGSQPLMGVPDAGKDTVLGMVNGSPIGLRGGEGILTPETVQALGGKGAIDRLNAMGINGKGGGRSPSFSSDENPWADPFKVGVTAYDSFSKGVAKYSPFGKYLEAAGQSLNSLEQEHEQAVKMNNQADSRMLHLEEMGLTPDMLNGMDPATVSAFMNKGGGGGSALAKFYGIPLPKHHRGGRGGGATSVPHAVGPMSGAMPGGGPSMPGSMPSAPGPASGPSALPPSTGGSSGSGSGGNSGSYPRHADDAPGGPPSDYNEWHKWADKQGILASPPGGGVSSAAPSGGGAGSGLGDAMGGAAIGGPGKGDDPGTFSPWWAPGTHRKLPDFNGGSGGGGFDLPAPNGRSPKGTPYPYTGDLGGRDPNPSLDKLFMGGGGGFKRGGVVPGYDEGGVVSDADWTAKMQEIFPAYKGKFTPHLREAMQAAGVNTPERAAQFLAQTGEESDHFQTTAEYGGAASEPAAGNYYGRGFIQTTFKGNYADFGKWAYSKGWVDSPDALVNNPDLVANSPKLASMSAAYYWMTGGKGGSPEGNSNNLNKFADKGDIKSISQAVNQGPGAVGKSDAENGGAPHGYSERVRIYNQLKGSAIANAVKGQAGPSTPSTTANPSRPAGGGGGGYADYKGWYGSGAPSGGGGKSLGQSYLDAAGNLVNHPLGTFGDSIGHALGFSSGGVVPGGIPHFDFGGVPMAPPPPAPPPPPPPAPPPANAGGGLGAAMGGAPKGGAPQQGQPVQKPAATAPSHTQQPTKPPAPPHGQDKQGPHDDLQKQFTPPGTRPGTAPKASGDRNAKDNPSRPGGTENTSKGFGVGGGLIGAAESAASTAASAFTFGAGGAASNMMFQLMNRAIGYGGQLVGIGMSGLLETFLPNDSKLGDPTNNLLGKMALGIAGAHPGPENMAGKSSMQLQPKQDLDQGAMAGKQMPDIHINGDVHNHGQQEWDGLQKTVSKATFGGLPVGGQG